MYQDQLEVDNREEKRVPHSYRYAEHNLPYHLVESGYYHLPFDPHEGTDGNVVSIRVGVIGRSHRCSRSRLSKKIARESWELLTFGKITAFRSSTTVPY